MDKNHPSRAVSWSKSPSNSINQQAFLILDSLSPWIPVLRLLIPRHPGQGILDSWKIWAVAQWTVAMPPWKVSNHSWAWWIEEFPLSRLKIRPHNLLLRPEWQSYDHWQSGKKRLGVIGSTNESPKWILRRHRASSLSSRNQFAHQTLETKSAQELFAFKIDKLLFIHTHQSWSTDLIIYIFIN